jgi:non-specific serine/threonine protein kinase/NIMA (never in mitosis gene a)-related kinase
MELVSLHFVIMEASRDNNYYKMDVYETVKTIGSGSFGQVYMARHKREGKNYVIKRVKTRDMTQKDLENTENEVRLIFS